ncbi:MAG TPA: hypothetical protein VF620_08780 [Allosphingosinicella sp.]
MTAMRMIRIVVPSSLLLVGVAAATGAPAPKPQPVKAAPASAIVRLLPLSDKDMMSTRQMGCTCAFDSKSGTLIQAIGNELMVRTQAGLKVCRIGEAQFQKLADASGVHSCGGVRMSLRRTGKVDASIESDSASSPASMTLGEGPSKRSVNGTWGCAC